MKISLTITAIAGTATDVNKNLFNIENNLKLLSMNNSMKKQVHAHASEGPSFH